MRSSVSRSAARSAGGDLASFSDESEDELPKVIDSLTIDLHAAVARFGKMDAPMAAVVTGAAGTAALLAKRSARFERR
ncbi:MAG: hypothetical protein ACFCVK_18585 [Acidimicrobiales bacterium]